MREKGIIGQNWHELRMKPEPYADTRPRLGHFTQHDEFFKESKRALPMEACTWQLSMRSGKALSAFENEPWEHLFQKHEHSFDMLNDAQIEKKKEESQKSELDFGKDKPSRPARNRVDAHRERKVHLEIDERGKEKHTSYTNKVTANSQRFRGFIEPQHTPRRTFGLDHALDPGKSGPRTHPDGVRWMINLRGGTREGESFRDWKAEQEGEEDEKKPGKK